MIKWYVNLVSKPADHHGARLPLKAAASAIGAGKSAKSEWWAEPGSGNTDLKYLSAGQRCRPDKPLATNEKDQFKNAFNLPHVGGDQYTFKCAKKGNRSKSAHTETYEIWRKIFYTVHWMDQDCKKLFDAVKDRFENAFKLGFVELEKAGASKTLVFEKRTFADPPELPHLYKKTPALAKKPFHLRIVLVRDLYDVEEVTHGTKSVSGTVFQMSFSGPLSDLAAKPWLRSATARLDGGGSLVDISSCVTKASDTEAKIDLTANKPLADAIAAGQKVKLELKVRVRQHYCGHSLGNFVVVRIDEPNRTPAQVQTTVLQTFTHEVGHGLQQVVQKEPLYAAKTGARDGSKFDDNPNWHGDDYGGRGPHCHTNAMLFSPAKTPSGSTYASAGAKLCTMFFRDDPDVDPAGKFCDSCVARLKRVNLDAGHMQAKFWDSY